MQTLDSEDRVELTTGLRLAAIALASAVVTATVVIGVGGAWLERTKPAQATTTVTTSEPAARLIRTSG